MTCHSRLTSLLRSHAAMRFVDLVRNWTTSVGAGDITLGLPVDGFKSISDELAIGEQFYYTIVNVDLPAETETGIGTLLAGGLIARAPTGGIPTDFSAGNKQISLVVGAAWFQTVDVIPQAVLDAQTAAGEAADRAADALASENAANGFATAAENAKNAADGFATDAEGAAAAAAASAASLVLDPDPTLAANADDRAASQKASKSYIDNSLLGVGTMALSLFTAAPAKSVPVGIDRVVTNGYSANGMGAASYIVDPAVDATYVAAHPRTSFLTANNRGFRLHHEKTFGILAPEYAGAIGDGVTNDHDAFQALHDIANTLGYFYLELTGGKTYIGGAQVADATYYRKGVSMVGAGTGTGINHLIVRGNGATLKTAPGLKYGAFDPVTGLPLGVTGTLDSQTAQGPSMISATSCDMVDITDLHLDGNPTSFIIGNNTNPGTLEAQHYGFRFIGNKVLRVDNFTATGFLQDCMALTNTTVVETDNTRPHTITNGVLDGGGRCCMSVLGGVNFKIDNVQMINPGASLIKSNGQHGTSPNVPCDIEAEGTIRQGKFTRCSFQQGVYGANSITCGSGDTKGVLFDDCLFVGSHLLARPRMTFRRCRFYGPFIQLYTNANPEDAMVFDECFLTDATWNDTPLQTGGGNIYFGTGGTGVRFKDTEIDVSRHKLTAIGGAIITGKNIWTFRAGTDIFGGGTAIVTLGAGYVDGLTLIENIAANVPVTPYTVTWTVGSAAIHNSEIISASGNDKIWWKDQAKGYSGKFDTGLEAQPGIDFLSNTAGTTLDISLSREIQALDSTLAAAKTLTLPPPTAGITRRYRIMRTANGGGAFNYNVNTSAAVLLYALVGPSCYVDVLSYKGAEYIVIGYGNLDSLSRQAIGYQAGGGGTVNQTTSKSTGVTLNTLTGQIPMNAAALAAGAKVSFTVTNNKVLATDIILVNVVSGGTAKAYRATVAGVAAGSFDVTVENITVGSLSESPVIGFMVLRGQNA